MDPPRPDIDRAPKVLIPDGILSLLALCLCVTRIYTHHRRPSKLTIDDYLIVAAEVTSLAGYVCLVVAASYGWGHHSYYVPQDRISVALKLLLVTQVQWYITISLIRISIAVWLLRLGRSWSWRISLLSIIVIQTLIGIGYIVVTFGVCHPLSYFWEPTPNLVCWPYIVGSTWGWTTAAFMITFDLVLALMPIRLIRTLSRPPREKILISCLMATGLIATTVACIKLWSLHNITHKWEMPDSMIDYTDTTLYSKLEELLGIIAACMPCLKRPAEEILRRIGVLREVHWPGMSKPSFVFSTGERSVAVQSTWSGPGQMPLQDVGRLLDKESQGSELGLARTRSMEWYTGTTRENGNSRTNTKPTPSLRTEEV